MRTRIYLETTIPSFYHILRTDSESVARMNWTRLWWDKYSAEMNPMSDEEIKEIRKIRHEISAECGHDIHNVVAHYRAVENQLRHSGQFQFEERSAVVPAHES